MMIKERSPKIVNIMTPAGARILLLQRGHIENKVKMIDYLKILFSTLERRSDNFICRYWPI